MAELPIEEELCQFKSNKATIYEQWTLLLECNYPAQHKEVRQEWEQSDWDAVIRIWHSFISQQKRPTTLL